MFRHVISKLYAIILVKYGKEGTDILELGLYAKNETLANEKCHNTGIKERLAKINYLKVTYYILMFCASCAVLPGNTAPFGLAFFAVEFLDSAPILPTVIALSSAALSESLMPAIFKTCIAIVLFTVAARKWDVSKSSFSKGLIMSICLFLAEFFQKIGEGILLYDIALLTLESTVLAASVYIFSRAKTVYFSNGDAGQFSSEDIICLTALLAIALAGTGAPYIFGIDPAEVLIVLLLIILSYKNGVAAGAAAGVAAGLISGFYKGDPAFVLSTFALGAVFSGFFAKYGRAASCISFIAAFSLISFYSVPFTSFLLRVAEISIASLVFLLLPEKALSAFFIAGEKKRSYADKLRELTYLDISESAAAISDVADIFEAVSENRLLGTEGAAASFFEKTARRLCDGCPRRSACWRSEFHRTYTSFFVMLQMCEKNGAVRACDIPDELKTKCSKREFLCGAVNGMYEVYKVDKLWESRVGESRTMLAQQLKSVSKRLLKTAKSVKSGSAFNSEKESAISLYLSENGIKTERVFAVQNRINIVLKERDENMSLVEELVSRCLGKKHHVVKKRDNVLYLAPFSHLKVEVGTARENKNQNPYSGDSANYTYLEDDKFYIVLSDGMGCGEKAGADSAAAVGIASEMLAAGFGEESTVSMVNSVLVLKSSETSFATLDMAILDLKRGTAGFYKSGAAASFIKRGEDVFPISASSLPTGAVSRADIDSSVHKIKEGDVLFMVSDGITGSGTADEICSVISKMEYNSPKDMAKELCKSASDLLGGIISDDMTVIAAALSEAD